MKPVSSLDWRGADAAPERDLILRNTTVLDPRAGIEGPHDIVIREGKVAELAAPGAGSVADAEVIDAEGLHAVPAFFDPHVHLRTPGREDKEDLETGTRAGAAGGYCGLLAMANTEPPVDTPAAIESLRERAGTDASLPTGFLATVTRGMRGEELTDMVELAEAGAVGFSDDGLPIRSGRVMRRALQYQALAGGQIALHEEDPELSGKGVMHEGDVSALVGMEGVPGDLRVDDDRPRRRARGVRGRPDPRPAPLRASIGRGGHRGEGGRCRDHVRGDAASPHAHRRGGPQPRCRLQDEPAASGRGRPAGAHRGAPSGVIDCIATDHAPHSPEEKEVPFEQAAMGVTGLETAFAAIHTELVLPGVLDLATVVDRMSAGAAGSASSCRGWRREPRRTSR